MILKTVGVFSLDIQYWLKCQITSSQRRNHRWEKLRTRITHKRFKHNFTKWIVYTFYSAYRYAYSLVSASCRYIIEYFFPSWIIDHIPSNQPSTRTIKRKQKIKMKWILWISYFTNRFVNIVFSIYIHQKCVSMCCDVIQDGEPMYLFILLTVYRMTLTSALLLLCITLDVTAKYRCDLVILVNIDDNFVVFFFITNVIWDVYYHRKIFENCLTLNHIKHQSKWNCCDAIVSYVSGVSSSCI